MKNKDKTENPEMSNKELLEIVLDLSRKINDIHRLHFSDQHLPKRKDQRQKFLAEILTSPAKNTKST
ncbi:MAG: hypothetical protein EOO20_22845 [Chryseobacterium sp.]|nr:MAG: hypothetical protein EOO20_22845 [Chryseobacterium sp.]